MKFYFFFHVPETDPDPPQVAISDLSPLRRLGFRKPPPPPRSPRRGHQGSQILLNMLKLPKLMGPNISLGYFGFSAAVTARPPPGPAEPAGLPRVLPQAELWH